MHVLIIFCVCNVASMAGSICGIGGGIIIKPVLDAMEVMPVSAVNFLSGVTVLCMSSYSLLMEAVSQNIHVNVPISLKLALGAAFGGVAGKKILDLVETAMHYSDRVKAIQATGLLILTIVTFIYILEKRKIKTLKIKNTLACIITGTALGIVSAFLGIGGGPFNIMFLSFFYSMKTKEAAINSLFIIMCSQLTNLLQTILNGSVPDFEKSVLLVMMGSGIIGGIIGRKINIKLPAKMIDQLFASIMVLIAVLCLHNIYANAGMTRI